MARKTSEPTKRDYQGSSYLRIPVKTHIIAPHEKLEEIIAKYAQERLQPGDWLVISESVVSITQGRAVPTKDIRLGILARILWRFVRKVPYGIGLRNPYSMQCAINETGRLRIVFAALAGGFTRLFGRRGDFYRLAGIQAAMIDAPTTSPVQEYKECVIMGPKDPDHFACTLAEIIGHEVAIMDINDIGGSWVVGSSKGINAKLMEYIMNDNPLGQQDELTPIGIVRKLE